MGREAQIVEDPAVLMTVENFPRTSVVGDIHLTTGEARNSIGTCYQVTRGGHLLLFEVVIKP